MHNSISKAIGNAGIWKDYGSAFIGLFGVLVGAFISYLFNQRSRKFDATARFAVQRKNLIYAPVYKELLKLSKYLEKNKDTCYLDILDLDVGDGYNEYYFNKKRRKSGEYILWNQLKNDIRKDYIPTKLRYILEKVNKNITVYTEKRREIENAFNELVKKETEGLYKGNSRLGTIFIPSIFFTKKDYIFNEDDTIEAHSVLLNDEYKDVKEKVFEICKNLANHINRKDFFSAYDNMIISITEAKKNVDRLVEFIIDKYEYGKELEKYDAR